MRNLSISRENLIIEIRYSIEKYCIVSIDFDRNIENYRSISIILSKSIESACYGHPNRSIYFDNSIEKYQIFIETIDIRYRKPQIDQYISIILSKSIDHFIEISIMSSPYT